MTTTANVTFRCECLDPGTDKLPSTWRVFLSKGNYQFDTTYTMGCAYRHIKGGKSYPNKPDYEDVLQCLTLDASLVRYGQSFEEFCDEIELDIDSRKAEQSYHQCRDIYFALLRLGFDLDELEEQFRDR